MDHGKIISNAWNITWNNKWLWGLGFLAALSSGGSGGGGNFNSGDMTFDPETGELPPYLEQWLTFLDDPERLMQLAGIAIAVVCLLFVIGIAIWAFVSNPARGGLIAGVNNIQEGQKSTFGESFRNGWQYVWRLLGLKIVLWGGFIVAIGVLVGIMAAIAGVGASADFNEDAVGGVVLLACGLLCIVFLFIIPLSFTDAYAFRGIVLREMGIMESIKHGWGLFRANAGDSLILGLIYGVISFAVGIAVAAVLVPFAFLAASPVMDLITTGEISTGVAVGLVFGGLLFTVLAALLNSVLVTFQSAGFTLAYRELTGLAPKIDIEKSPDDLDDGGDFI